MVWAARLFARAENTAAVVAIVTGMLALAGMMPRLGPARAGVLAFSTWEHNPARAVYVDSQRVDDVKALRRMLDALTNDQYLVVRGPKGVGKTCLVRAALAGMPGVVYVKVHPGTDAAQIEKDALKAIARYKVDWMGAQMGADRVLACYNAFMSKPPVVVLCVGERAPDAKYANVGSAVRSLVDHGVRVVVDASDNSLDEMAVGTLREDVLEVGEMPREVLESIPEFASLLASLQKHDGLSDLAWGVLGGNPACYEALATQVQQSSQPFKEVVEDYLKSLLRKAATTYRITVAANPQMEPVYEMFKKKEEVPENVLGKKISMPSPDKVLRLVGVRGSVVGVLRPTSAAMRLVLRYGEGVKAPSLEAVKTALAREKKAAEARKQAWTAGAWSWLFKRMQ